MSDKVAYTPGIDLAGIVKEVGANVTKYKVMKEINSLP